MLLAAIAVAIALTGVFAATSAAGPEEDLQATLGELTATLDENLSAQEEGPSLGELIEDAGLSGQLNQLLNSVPLDSLLGPIGDLLCPVVTAVDDALEPVPPAQEITGLVRAIVCNLGQLSFEFYTVWEASNGDLVKRRHQAVVGAPTPLDVDNDPAPDLTGTINLSPSLDQVTLTIDRTDSGPLPVSVEAIIDNLGGVAGKDMVAFGYDQLGDRAPGGFEATVSIPGLIGSGDPEFDIDVRQSVPGTGTNIVGSFFNGTPVARNDLTEVRLEYAQSPNRTGLNLTMADPLIAEITTNVTGPVVAKLTDNDGADSFAARAAIEDLPRVFNLNVGFENPHVIYTGADGSGNPAGIDLLNLNVDSTSPIFSRAHHVRATIESLPSGTEVTVDQDGQQVGLVASQPINSIELFGGEQAEQPADLPAAGTQGANYIDRPGDPFVLGARIFDLEQLSANLGDAIGLHARTAGGPFDLIARVEGLEVDAAIRDLPNVFDLSFDANTGAVAYSGSSGIDSINLNLASAEPLISAANQVALTLEGVPDAFELGLAPGGNGLSFSSDNPLGLIEAKALSPGATDESGLIGAGETGAVLRDVGGEFFLFTRLFGMEGLDVSLDPIALSANLAAGHVFKIDAQVEQDGGGVVDVDGAIDQLPSQFSLGLADQNGTQLTLNSNDVISLLTLNANGLELLPGTDDVKLALHDVPTELTVNLPESGPLATLNANGEIGLLRLAAAAGNAALPGTSGNDQFSFSNVPGSEAVGVKLSAISGLSVNLDPINISLDQDNALTRPIDLAAAVDSNGDTINVDGLLDKPGDTTSLSVNLDPNQPTALEFDNSHNMDNFDLTATGLPGLSSVTANFDNLSKRMSICMDAGPSCQRPNPHGVQRYGGSNATVASLDFDDHGTHGAGNGPAFRTTLNASINFDSGDPITITNLRFRNLGFDFEDANNNHSSNCGTIPRISLFFDSRSHPFVINSIKYPPSIVDFRIGTDGNPARANNRIARLNGWNGGFFGCLSGINTSAAGGLNCGGQQVLRVDTPLGVINILDFLGFQLVPICGGSVSTSIPW